MAGYRFFGGANTSPGLLGLNQYAPSTTSTYSVVGTTMTAVDTTNMTVPFTAPASGRVLIRLTALTTAAADNTYWGLLDHTSAALRGVPVLVTESSVGYNLAAVFIISGLTPGTAYQVDWAMCNSTGGATSRLYAGNGTVASTYVGPAVMEVWSA